MDKERNEELRQILEEYARDIRERTVKQLYKYIIESCLIPDRNRWRLKALLKCKYGVEVE